VNILGGYFMASPGKYPQYPENLPGLPVEKPVDNVEN
jgi:hypothetical protein